MTGEGIDYANSLFRRADGSTRILSIWDQSNQAGIAPPGFFYGSEFSMSDINAALQQNNPLDYVNHYDENGHGTMMAGIASGSIKEDNFMFTSPAPETELVVVKLKEAKEYLKELFKIPSSVTCYEETDIIAALAYVRRFVKVTTRPVVICLGLGTSQGNHSGRSTLGSYIGELLSNRNISLVCPIGNEGNTRRHFEGIFQSGEQGNQVVEISVEAGNPGFFMEFWAPEPSVFRLTLRSPSGESTGIIDSKSDANVTTDFVYGGGSVNISYVLSEDHSGWQAAFFRFNNPLEGVWTLSVENADRTVISNYHIWLPMKEFLAKSVYFPRSSPYVTLTSPSGNKGAISVSGYDSDSGGFFVESSRGYTSEGGIKPDFSAPAVDISTPYGSRSGTETGAAITAGAVCQLMEWAVIQENDPYIDSNGVKNYLTRGATRERDIVYPNREWGYGKLNLETVFSKIAGIYNVM